MAASPVADAADATDVTDVPGGPTSSYVPVGPHRLADTREQACGCTRVDASTIRSPVSGPVGEEGAIPAC